MSTSLDPRTLATPNEQVVLTRGLGSVGTVRVLTQPAGATIDLPSRAGSARPAGLRSSLAWVAVEAVEAGRADLDDVHVLLLAAGGADESRAEVLAAVRPWVVLVRTERDDAEDWERELLDAKYVIAVFDGRTRYFVSPGHDDLPAAFASGDAAAWDGLVEEIVRWRTAALYRWVLSTATRTDRESLAERELHALRQTVSWRVTAPLRKVRGRMRP